jgi:predicted DsbA family dithiol-disulfide isomerase
MRLGLAPAASVLHYGVVNEIEVVEFTDPGCSWAWGTEPKLRLLRWRYGDKLRWRRVLGGLVGDLRTQVAKDHGQQFDPVRLAKRYGPYWAEVYKHTGMTWPTKLQWMAWSTVPACKAVKAAELQSDELGAAVLRRMREQTFVFGEPADDTKRIIAAVRGIDGLDQERFAVDLESELTEKSFREDWDETRRPNEYVMTLEGDWPGIGRAKQTDGHWRFVFPTLIFRGADHETTVPGWCPYDDYEAALEFQLPGVTDERRADPTPEEAFATWPSLAAKELEILCGPEARPPDGVIAYDWGEGEFFLTRREASARKLKT